MVSVVIDLMYDKYITLLAEILEAKLRQNDKMKPVVSEEDTDKGAQYADDLWLLLYAEEESLKETLNELSLFEKFSGLKINYHKTNVIRIGMWANTAHKINTTEQIKWTNEP